MPNTETKPAKPANQPPNQTPDTAKTSDIPARARAKRKFDAAVIESVAILVSRALSETEAIRQLGYEPRQWFTFKSRGKNDERFCALLEKFRGARIEKLIARIEKSANGQDVKFPDFRAALALLKIIDQRRFGDSPLVEVNVRQPLLSDADMQRILGRMYKENPEFETDGLFNDVRLGYRKRESLEWKQTPGQPPKRTKIRPEVKELLLAKLNAKPAIDIPASEPKQIENAKP